MWKRTIAILTALLVIVASEQLSGPSTSGQSDSPPPVDNWGNWWPDAQFGEDDGVTSDQVAKADRGFNYVNYSSLKSPWGFASVYLGNDSAGLQLSFSISTSDDENIAAPKAGDVKGAILLGSKVVREQTNEPMVEAWIGRMGSRQGTFSIEFQHLPADFEDYWLRVDLQKQRHRFLIPYGLGSDLTAPPLKLVQASSPKTPQAVRPEDSVHLWSSVAYELGRIAVEGWRVEAFISNEFDTELTLRLYDEKGRWTLAYPRTTAVYNWPEGYARFASWLSVSRGDIRDMFRSDRFKFWRTPFDTRNWGLLRVTVEHHVFERAVPSSLFHYTHGTIDK